MDTQFWINAWNEGRTSFHQDDYHPKLTEYFPLLDAKKGQSVLVPLCGKSKDLLWLHRLNLVVHGIELHDGAVKSFFEENKLSPIKITQDQDFTHYSFQNIDVSCGDFFKLNKNDTYDLIYDRASLVALPVSMRRDYAQIIKRSLKKGGKCLLIVYEYDQLKMEGPPFSVDANEIHKLYEDQCTIKLLESLRPLKEGARLSALEDSLRQKVYIIEKISDY